MSDRKGLADDCLRLAEDRSHSITPAVRCALRMASDALRQEPSVEEVARVLEPWGPPEPGRGPVTMSRWEAALAKAQAIHAMYRRGEDV